MPPFFSPSFIFASVDESPTNSSATTTATLAPPLPCTDDERQEILRALEVEGGDDDKGDARRRSLLFMAVQSWFKRLDACL